MTHRHYSPAEAAQRLGVSTKALRLYEQRGLITPLRTEAGWRAYGPDQMARAREIASLRALGLSLSEVARVLTGDPAALEQALAAHQSSLESRQRGLAGQTDRVRALRADLAAGRAPDLASLTGPPAAAFGLPWPWGAERFELQTLKPLTWLVGSLGSGKTRLAVRLAEELPGATFLPLDRQADAAPGADEALTWLIEDGATPSPALTALLVALTADGPGPLVIDLIEQGLDHATQEALAAWLRTRARRPVIAMTRSTAMLDLTAVGPDEALLFCPANHSPPMLVGPWPGSPGYEALADCLAPPEVRSRTEGMRATLPAA